MTTGARIEKLLIRVRAIKAGKPLEVPEKKVLVWNDKEVKDVSH